MFPDHLLHPDHVVPAAELITALMKLTALGIPQMLMEMLAVSGKVFILFYRVADAGIEVRDAHVLKLLFELLIECSSAALALDVVIKIDRDLA